MFVCLYIEFLVAFDFDFFSISIVFESIRGLMDGYEVGGETLHGVTTIFILAFDLFSV